MPRLSIGRNLSPITCGPRQLGVLGVVRVASTSRCRFHPMVWIVDGSSIEELGRGRFGCGTSDRTVPEWTQHRRTGAHRCRGAKRSDMRLWKVSTPLRGKTAACDGCRADRCASCTNDRALVRGRSFAVSRAKRRAHSRTAERFGGPTFRGARPFVIHRRGNPHCLATVIHAAVTLVSAPAGA